MSEDDSPKLICRPSDGLYKKEHSECKKCCWRARRICEVFAIELERQDRKSALEEEIMRLKRVHEEREDV